MAPRVGWARMKQQIILTALLATSALATLAQDADTGAPHGGRPPRGPGGPGHRPPPFIAALDVNKEGVTNPPKWANAPAAPPNLKKKGAGKITADELHPAPPADPPHPPADAPKRPVPAMLKALDTDGDGVIS